LEFSNTGEKDRAVNLPESIRELLRKQIDAVISLHKEDLPIRALKFRQDHRIKKHNPSSREGVQHCANNTVKQGKKHLLLAFRPFFTRKRNCVFSASSLRGVGSTLRPVSPTGWKRSRRLEGVKKNQVNPVNPVRKLRPVRKRVGEPLALYSMA